MNRTETYPPPDFDDLPKDIREIISAAREELGFVPNVFRTLSRRPAELRAFLAYYEAIMLREPSGLTPTDREMIIVATSSANGCVYCTVAHGATLRQHMKDAEISDQLTANYLKADISDRQKVMLDYAMKVCLHPATINNSDHDALRRSGFDDEDIWDIGAITGFFGLSNRMVNVTNMTANEEYYLMGRCTK